MRALCLSVVLAQQGSCCSLSSIVLAPPSYLARSAHPFLLAPLDLSCSLRSTFPARSAHALLLALLDAGSSRWVCHCRRRSRHLRPCACPLGSARRSAAILAADGPLPLSAKAIPRRSACDGAAAGALETTRLRRVL